MAGATPLGLPVIMDLLTSELKQLDFGHSPESRMLLLGTLRECALQQIPQAEATSICAKFQGVPMILARLIAILNCPEAPLPSAGPTGIRQDRRRPHPWTGIEDTRLLAGVFRYGLENWSLIAGFVGNDRTRAQCAQ
jgi:hypothetical protein